MTPAYLSALTGSYPDPSVPAVDFDTLSADMVVADAIPNPPRTGFLAEAAGGGCTTLDGLGPLVNRGLIDTRRRAGREAGPHVIHAALAEALR